MAKQQVIDTTALHYKNAPIIDEDTGEITELPKWKNVFNAHLFPEEINLIDPGESLTVPNQSMTIPEMMERLNNGLSVTGNILEYGDNEDDDDPLPIIQDLMDIEEAREFARRILNDYDQKVKESKTKKKTPEKPPKEEKEGGE